jgi:hypothetical protein
MLAIRFDRKILEVVFEQNEPHLFRRLRFDRRRRREEAIEKNA